MKATDHRTATSAMSALLARRAWDTQDLIATIELSGLVFADQAGSALMEVAAGPALIDFRRAVLAVSAKDFFRLRAAAGGRAALALLGTDAQLDTLSESAWRMCQFGYMTAAFDDEALALEWMALWGVPAASAVPQFGGRGTADAVARVRGRESNPSRVIRP